MHISFIQMRVAPEIGTGVMKASSLAPQTKLLMAAAERSAKNAHGRIHRADIAGTAAHILMNFLVAGKAEFPHIY